MHHPICIMKSRDQSISAYKLKEESGFDAFGINFTSTNNLDTYFFFIKSLKKAVEIYTKNPAVDSALSGLEELRSILRENLRIT